MEAVTGDAAISTPIAQAIHDLTRAIIAASAHPEHRHVIDTLCAAREYAEAALRGEGPEDREP